MAENIENNETVKTDKNDETKKGGVRASLYDTVSVVITSIMLIAFTFTFGFRPVGVDGDSMLDTLRTGDWLFVTHYYSEPQYGDIVISAKKTAARGSLVKRVIAVAGDEVDIDENDNVYVNGEKINDEGFTRKDGKRRGDLTYPVTVPEGCVMLMGDNRIVSWDSRYSDIGFAEYDHLLGKAQFRLGKNWDIYYNFSG